MDWKDIAIWWLEVSEELNLAEEEPEIAEIEKITLEKLGEVKERWLFKTE